MTRIGIITSGGDAGGLNAVLRGAAQMAASRKARVFVVPNGYAGLYNLVEAKTLTELTESRLEQFSSMRAGSEAGHSRVKISAIKDPKRYQRIAAGLKKHDLHGLVISGGDDTGSVVVDLSEQGIACVHAPKTMDLDLQTYSVGGDSAVNRIARFVEDLKTTGRTHNRIMITEVFGRYAGHTAFYGGVAADADCILIPEIPADMDVVYRHASRRLMRRIDTSDVNAGTYTVVVAEGLQDATGGHITDSGAGVDAFGHKKLAGAGKNVRDALTRRLEADPEVTTFMRRALMFVPGVLETPEVREIVPSHLVRSGEVSGYDANFGKQIGGAAVLLLQEGVVGVTVVGVQGGVVRHMPTKIAIQQNHVDPQAVAYYESMGICFGREPQPYQPRFVSVASVGERYL